MLERGMMSQSKVLARAMLETVFILVALQKKPDLLQCYSDQHEDGTKRALKAAMQFKNKNLRASSKKHNLEKHYIEKKNFLKGKIKRDFMGEGRFLRFMELDLIRLSFHSW